MCLHVYNRPDFETELECLTNITYHYLGLRKFFQWEMKNS